MSNLKGVKKPLLRRPTKRMSGVLASLIGVILLSVVTWFMAANAWQSTASSATRDQQTATKIRQAALNSTKKEERLVAVAELAAIQYAPERCNGGWWYAWQQNVSKPANAAKTRCVAANQSLGAINKASTALKRYLQDEKTIEAQLTGLKIDSKQKDWQVQAVNSATKSYDALQAAKVSKMAQPLLTEATKRVESVTKAWKLLNEADKKQDKTAYRAAMTALSDSYAGLAAASDVSDTQVSTLANTLKNAE